MEILQRYRPRVAVCDLDGTLTIHQDRSPFQYHKIPTDILNPQVAAVLRALETSGDIEGILFVSGREATPECRMLTCAWLTDNSFPPCCNNQLFMRAAKDFRPDDIVKREIYDTCIKDQYEVFCVIDDRPKVIRMWLSLGLYVFAAGGGQREF